MTFRFADTNDHGCPFEDNNKAWWVDLIKAVWQIFNQIPPMSSWIQYLDIKILTLTKSRCLDNVNSLLEVNMDEPPTLTKLGLFYSQFGKWLGEKCTFLLNNFNCEKYIGPRWWCRGWGGIIWQRALTWRNPESSDGSWEQWAGTFSICIFVIVLIIVILIKILVKIDGANLIRLWRVILHPSSCDHHEEDATQSHL